MTVLSINDLPALPYGYSTEVTVNWLGMIAGPLATSPSPAPAPTTTSAPWWGVPVVAGCFLLIGALIAFLSTAASDRRKLAREDRRQWDKEIRDAYIDIAGNVNEIAEFRWSQAVTDEEKRVRYEAGSLVIDKIRIQGDLLRVIGTRPLVERVETLESSCWRIVTSWHDGINPDKYAYRDLRAALGELLNTVKSEIRVERYKPFVRPPMSRITRIRVGASVKGQALKRAIRRK
jgi:hypothetical protein